MKKSATIFLILSFSFLALIFSGCQSTPQTEQAAPTQQVPLVPFSKGPSTPPSVKGPSGPPLGSSSTPQAVTETETVRYTLPGTSTMQVKN